MRSNVYRLTLISFLLGSLGLSSYFLFLFITTKQEINSQVLNCIATIILMIITLFEITFLFMGLKKDRVIIHDLCYEGKDINKGPLVINNVFLGVSVITIIVLIIMLKITPENTMIFYFLINIGVYVTINTTYYDLYFLLHHLEENDEKNKFLR